MKAKIVKDAVIAWIITRSVNASGSPVICGTPLKVDWRGLVDYDPDLLEDFSNTMAVIPAVPGTFQVWGSYGDDKDWELLGYEIPGCSHPDWTQELRERIEAKQMSLVLKV